MFIHLNPHASQFPGCPTQTADTFLCGWAHTQTKLLRSAMWRIPTEVKHNSETEPSYESGSAAQFSREASDPVSSSYNRFNRETVESTGQLKTRSFVEEKMNRKVQLNRLNNYQLLYILFQEQYKRFVYCRFSWPGHQNYNISFHSGAFLAAPSVTGESLECWQSSRAKSTLAEKALLRRRGTINTSSSSSKDRKNNTANEGLSKLDSTAIYKPVKANRPPLNRQSCSTGKVAFQLTQRLHIFTCSHVFQLCAISAAFIWCCDLALSSSCCRTCLATSRSCSRTLSSSFSCSRRLLFFSMLSSWLWRRMDTSFATWEGGKRSDWDDYTVFRLLVLLNKCKG